MRGILLGCIALIIVSCDLFTREDLGEPVARAGEEYLYEADINDLLKDLPTSDSATVVSSYIDNWARTQLLLQGALRNIASEDQERFEKLIQNYREDLFITSYKDALLSQELDSIISPEEAQAVYDAQKETFVLNEDLLQLRYILIDPEYTNLKKVRDHLKNYEEEDKAALDSLSFQFKKSFLNDSIWIQERAVVKDITAITAEEAERLLKKSNLLELRDSLGLYLVAIKNTLSRNEIAPLSYVRPTIDKIILNKRKLKLSKQLDKEIVDDAIKDKKYEIYN